MKRVLVSAFLPFGNKENNYSCEVLEFVESGTVKIDKAVIDVVYDRCFDDLAPWGLDGYDFIVALGEARMRDRLTVESRAKNVSDCSLPDNSGEVRRDRVIDYHYGEYIESEMELERLSHLADISHDAGKFVCNNLYFHLLKYDATRTLFIHVPECNNDVEKYREIAARVSKIIEAL